MSVHYRSTTPLRSPGPYNDTTLHKSNKPVPLSAAAAAAPPHEAWKNIDFTKFGQFWNLLVDSQSRAITDSNQRLYYKLPQQLEVHHKKTILWSSEHSTLADGINFAGHKPLLDLLNSDENYPPRVELQDAEISMEIGPLQTTTPSAPLVKPAQYQLLLPGAAPPTAESESSKSGDRCTVCTKAYCEKRKECPGKGVRRSCSLQTFAPDAEHQLQMQHKAQICVHSMLQLWDRRAISVTAG
ncbi:hypothetical protein C8R44DRAFT_745261 [Mycena epipterygia]|nr:hypothetical protein C8R44DRAFT_745261 [Mycena epipterygia]